MEWLSEILRKPPPAKPGEVNYSFVDRFTLVHLGIGVGYGAIGFSLGLAALLAVGWEIIENPMKVRLPFLFPHATADTAQNMIGDICAVILGWTIGYYSGLF